MITFPATREKVAGPTVLQWPWGGAPTRENTFNYKTQACDLIWCTFLRHCFSSSPLFYPNTILLGEIHKEKAEYSCLVSDSPERQRWNSGIDFFFFTLELHTKYIEIHGHDGWNLLLYFSKQKKKDKRINVARKSRQLLNLKDGCKGVHFSLYFQMFPIKKSQTKAPPRGRSEQCYNVEPR